MRNLFLGSIHNENIPCDDSSLPLYVYLDEINNCIIVFAKDFKITIYEYSPLSTVKMLKEIELEVVLSTDHSDLLMSLMETIEQKNNPIKFLTYKAENEEVAIGLESSMLISITEGKGKVKKLSSQSAVKLLAMEASPNQEYIIAILSNYSLIMLSYADYTVINTCDLDDNDLSKVTKDSICSTASLSWKGSSDLFAVIYQVNNGSKCLVRDIKLNIMKGPARADNKIVYSIAEAPLEYMSSNIVSFQPNGSLIALFNEEKNIIFFTEKNGLIHGEFSLNEKDKIVPKFLKWNLDLPMFVFIYEKKNISYITIYYRSNYEWNRKYYNENSHKVITAKFSDLLSTQLFIYYGDGTLQFIDFVFGYNTILPNGNNEINNGAICVTVKDSIRFTALGICNMPSPMCMKQIQSQLQEMNDTNFFWHQNYFFGFAMKNDQIIIDVYITNQRDFDLLASLKLNMKDNDINIDNVKKVIFIPNTRNSKGVFVVNSIEKKNCNYNDKITLIAYNIDYENNNSNEAQFIIKKINDYSHSNTHIIPNAYYGLIFNSISSDKTYSKKYWENPVNKPVDLIRNKQDKSLDMITLESFNQNEIFLLNDNVLYFYYVNANLTTKENDFMKYSYDLITREINETLLSISHYSKEVITVIQSGITYNNEEKIFYLTRNNRLYMESTLIAMDVNSFALFKNFLLFTQISSSPYSTLHLIDLNKQGFLPKNINEISIAQKLDYKDFNMRTIERGSQIVTCCGVQIILQMPRGNLETISPRLIILHEIKTMINQEKYEAAFLLARKHKINLNYLYDIDPISFMKNIKKFIQQVYKVDYINLFINSLSSDICEEYKILFDKSITVANVDKINQICDDIRKILQEESITCMTNQQDYTNTILLSFIKKTPPQYLEALKLVQKIKLDSKQTTAKADKALAFLCWIIKAETLFDFALKTYDFELVIMCAKHTQKDPKEYLAYLNQLQELNEKDPIMMKYQINMDLKFYSDALIELSKGNEKHFDQCLGLIKQYNLYELGLCLFSNPNQEKQFQAIYDAKSISLYNNKINILEAAIGFMRSKDYDMALKCYLEEGQSNEVLTLSSKENLYQNIIELLDTGKLKHKTNEIEKIFTYFIALEKKSNYFTNEQYKTICLKLLDSMLQCQMFTSAYYTTITLVKLCSNEKNSQDIKDIGEVLLNKLNEKIDLQYSYHLNNLNMNLSAYKSKHLRLEKVQQMKRENPELFILDYMHKDNEDNVSDTGSIRSRSMKSGTSKASRKTKMKNPRRNLKEGSPMEEENLIAIIKDLKLGDETIMNMADLIKILFLLKKGDKATELKNAKENYVKNVNEKINKLYSIEQIKFIDSNPQLRELFPDFKVFACQYQQQLPIQMQSKFSENQKK